jgi:hydrogenase expression/formation protein HypD
MLLTKPPENFSILSCHRIVPPAMKWLLEQGEAKLDGFMLPGHVCVVMGYEEYEVFPVPQVVAGFEAEDILLGLLMLVQQLKEGTHRVDNAYPRAVCREGNVKAKKSSGTSPSTLPAAATRSSADLQTRATASSSARSARPGNPWGRAW